MIYGWRQWVAANTTSNWSSFQPVENKIHTRKSTLTSLFDKKI